VGDDWKPGDLALCVRGCPVGLDDTKPGAIYTVGHVTSALDYSGRVLYLKEAPHRGSGSRDYRFRKIHPHTPDEQDAETIRLLNGVPTPAPAETSPSHGAGE
jgi:hypothetical protein